jgi:hypothetical protein
MATESNWPRSHSAIPYRQDMAARTMISIVIQSDTRLRRCKERVAGDDVDVFENGFVNTPGGLKSTPLSDLETQYGVLAEQLVQDQNVLCSR